MVGKRPHRPAIGGTGEKLLDLAAKEGGGVIIAHQLETVALMQPTGGGVIAHHPDRMVAFAHFTNGGAVVILIHQRADPFHPRQVFRLVLREDVVLHAVWIGFGLGLDPVIGGIGAQQLVVEKVVHRIKPEAVNPAIQPEPHVFQLPVLHCDVVEIEIGLVGQEIMQVILLAPCIPLPDRAAKHRQPVVRRRAIEVGVGPDIPIGLWVVAAGAAFLEKRMLDRTVAENLINHHFQPQFVGACHQRVKIGQGAEARIDIGVVRHVIAHVGHRRGEDRRQPDRINPECRHMIQPRRDAGQITNTVAVAVLKRPRIDLIDHRTTPPVVHRCPLVVRPVCR